MLKVVMNNKVEWENIENWDWIEIKNISNWMIIFGIVNVSEC